MRTFGLDFSCSEILALRHVVRNGSRSHRADLEIHIVVRANSDSMHGWSRFRLQADGIRMLIFGNDRGCG
jgi:hypothetical protein